MIILKPQGLRWLTKPADDPQDLCAHGKVTFEIDGTSLITPEDGEWTVSAAALYLLRTLDNNFAQEPFFVADESEQIFPCCGFEMYDVEGEDDVLILGCPNGINLQIAHDGKKVEIKAEEKNPIFVSYADWRDAVVKFSEIVRAFYASSSTKQAVELDLQQGFNKFLSEWERRHLSAIQT